MDTHAGRDVTGGGGAAPFPSTQLGEHVVPVQQTSAALRRSRGFPAREHAPGLARPRGWTASQPRTPRSVRLSTSGKAGRRPRGAGRSDAAERKGGARAGSRHRARPRGALRRPFRRRLELVGRASVPRAVDAAGPASAPCSARLL